MSRLVPILAATCLIVASWQPLQAQGATPPDGRTAAVERTRQTLEAYWQEHDPRFVAEDAEFTMMPTGEVIRGRAAIAQHLHHFYHEAFNARAERVHAIFGEDEGLLEAVVVGTHTGEFGGISATGRSIRVPLSVSYELENGLIRSARIYLMTSVLLRQIGTDG